jgi:hypothetical protein
VVRKVAVRSELRTESMVTRAVVNSPVNTLGAVFERDAIEADGQAGATGLVTKGGATKLVTMELEVSKVRVSNAVSTKSSVAGVRHSMADAWQMAWQTNDQGIAKAVIRYPQYPLEIPPNQC